MKAPALQVGGSGFDPRRLHQTQPKLERPSQKCGGVCVKDTLKTPTGRKSRLFLPTQARLTHSLSTTHSTDCPCDQRSRCPVHESVRGIPAPQHRWLAWTATGKSVGVVEMTAMPTGEPFAKAGQGFLHPGAPCVRSLAAGMAPFQFKQTLHIRPRVRNRAR